MYNYKGEEVSILKSLKIRGKRYHLCKLQDNTIIEYSEDEISYNNKIKKSKSTNSIRVKPIVIEIGEDNIMYKNYRHAYSFDDNIRKDMTKSELKNMIDIRGAGSSNFLQDTQRLERWNRNNEYYNILVAGIYFD